jgi:hypothetical protein
LLSASSRSALEPRSNTVTNQISTATNSAEHCSSGWCSSTFSCDRRDAAFRILSAASINFFFSCEASLSFVASSTRTDVLAFSLHFANAFAYRHRVCGKRIVIARQTPCPTDLKKPPLPNGSRGLLVCRLSGSSYASTNSALAAMRSRALWIGSRTSTMGDKASRSNPSSSARPPR